MGKETVTITDNRTGKKIEISIKNGTIGNGVFNIGELKQLDLFTIDPGFMTTASCESEITFIDGEKGILLYRGYPIEELAEKSSFLETCYLLLNKEIPNFLEFQKFKNEIIKENIIDECFKDFYKGFQRDSHPMGMLLGSVGYLSASNDHWFNINNEQSKKKAINQLIAKIPIIIAWIYKSIVGQPFVYPKNHLEYVENFLTMMFSLPNKEIEINSVVVEALDKILILHADHEQNASTSTVRLVGSSKSNLFACIASGITALWGYAHGGANEKVITMLENIKNVRNINQYIEKAKDKNDPFRLMGFGHRLYKNYDPRAKILKTTCDEVLNKMDINNPLFEIAKRIEEIALNDEYFISKKLYPNVDFYSGIILKAIGIPKNMFTVIFALSRNIGWIAHWMEMTKEIASLKIGRPRQLYIGYSQRNYISLDQRR